MVVRSLPMTVALLFLLLALPTAAAGTGTPTPAPPSPPREGPGSVSAAYPGVATERVESGAAGYWRLVPTDGDGEPVLDDQLPLVVFLHGFSAVDPVAYQAWLDHIVRRGAIVIYPIYQVMGGATGDGGQYLPNVRTGIRTALEDLTGESPDAVDLDRVAVAGHSAGGLLAVQYALSADEEGLPVPKVLLTMTPGGCAECGSIASLLQMPTDLDGDLDPATLAVLFEVEDDQVVGDGASLRIWRTLLQLPEDQRDRVIWSGDGYGSPPLVAEHNTPQTIAPGQPDAVDYWSVWKLLDGLMSCSFDGEDCASALGGGDAQTSMGEWDDGQPVVPLTVTDDF